jgi:hypothetical protein
VYTTAVKFDHISYSTVSRVSRIGRLLPSTDQAPVSIAAASSLFAEAVARRPCELSIMKMYVGMKATFKRF